MEHQRGLPGAVGTQHGDALAAVHEEVRAEERLVPVRIGEGQALNGEYRGAHGATSAVRLARAHARGSRPLSAHCAAVAVRGRSVGMRPV